MSHNQGQLGLIMKHDDCSTAWTANTPPSTVVVDSSKDHNGSGRSSKPGFFLVPWPGSNFIIRCVSSGRVITLFKGHLTLTSPGVVGASIHWACVETNGWLGFRNVSSGKFLGHDKDGKLVCVANQHKWWESFSVRVKPEGGCVLLMTHHNTLWHVGMVKSERGEEKLAKVGEGGSNGMVWEFLKV